LWRPVLFYEKQNLTPRARLAVGRTPMEIAGLEEQVEQALRLVELAARADIRVWTAASHRYLRSA
jgi:hypothetical protein